MAPLKPFPLPNSQWVNRRNGDLVTVTLVTRYAVAFRTNFSLTPIHALVEFFQENFRPTTRQNHDLPWREGEEWELLDGSERGSFTILDPRDPAILHHESGLYQFKHNDFQPEQWRKVVRKSLLQRLIEDDTL